MSGQQTQDKQHDLLDAEQQAHDGIRTWIASELGGEVTGITCLERWRPQWKVTYTAGAEEGAVLVRGNR